MKNFQSFPPLLPAKLLGLRNTFPGITYRAFDWLFAWVVFCFSYTLP